jgi:hypothetical protein
MARRNRFQRERAALALRAVGELLAARGQGGAKSGMTSEGCEEGSSHPYALVPAGKRRDVRVKYDPVLIGFPDSVHSHKGVVVLTSVGYDRSRRWRRRLVIWTCEAIPVRRHRRMIALHIYTLASDYVVTELWPWEIVAEADSCEKVNDMVVSQCSASAANGSTFAVGCTIRAISHGIQRLSFAIVVQKDITAAWYEKVSHTIRVARVQIMRVSIPQLVDSDDVLGAADAASFNWIN